MKRFLAVVGLVAFVAACSDSSSTAPLRASAGVAAHSPGDPPPPPLSGADGFGDLNVGGFGSDVVASAQPAIPCSYGFSLNFSWSYLQSNGSGNQVVHLNLIGSPSGNIDLHDIQNGKIITHGTISDGLFSFTIQGTDNLDLSSEGFSAQVTGTLTNLTSRAKCQATAQLNGFFESEGD